MNFWTWTERALSVVLTLAAVAVAVRFVTLKPDLAGSSPEAARVGASPQRVEGWSDAVERGIRLGPKDAPVTIMAFLDFQCPYCARFSASLDTLRREFPQAVQVVIYHFPLESHPFARPSSTAAQCAAEQGAFSAYAEVLFRNQASLGNATWLDFAKEAGVGDLKDFGRCMESEDVAAKIAEGRNLGSRIGIKGTPAVVIDGWLMPRPPSLDELRAHVEAEARGAMG